MSGLETFLTVTSIGCIAFSQRKAAQGSARDIVIVRFLLLFALCLCLVLFIFPAWPGPTSWVIRLFESLHFPSVQ